METVIHASLRRVRDAVAYIGIIGFRYGFVREFAELNPDGLSLTELEFREARRLRLPILTFIMGPDHPVKAVDVDMDSRRQKLDAFRER